MQLNRRTSLTSIRFVLCAALLFTQLVPTTGQVSNGESGSPVKDPSASTIRTSALIPIVFVPGTAGSELRLTNSSKTDVLYWVGLPTLKKNGIKIAQLDKCGNEFPGSKVHAASPLTSVLGIPIYSNFLSWARAVFPSRLYEVPYDWRKGASKESSDLLDKVVDRAIAESGHGKVIILAHSLGGLVSRDYIVRTGGKKVAALIAVGTPWLGTPKTVRALLWGYNFGVGKVMSKKGKITVKGIPDSYVSPVCVGARCDRLENISFLRMSDVQKLAINFPGVYQQLPTEEFMKTYGEASGQPFRGVIWDKNSWAEMEDFYRTSNSCLFDQSQLWRANFLNGQDTGVKHYLVAGVYSPGCKDSGSKDCQIDNRMDMQMANVNQINKSNFSRFYSALIKILNVPLSIFKFSTQRDPFVAVDSDYQWGDGTSPLLSATAGEYVRGDLGRVKPSNATRYLGPGTEVPTPIQLGPKYGHSAMLDDPQVRKLIVALYKAESLKLGVDPVFPELTEEVNSIKIKVGFENNAVINRIQADLKVQKIELTQSGALIPNTYIEFKSFEVKDSVLNLPKAKPNSKTVPATRKLLTADIDDLTLTLTITKGRTVRVTSLEVLVNDVTRLKDETPFELTPGRGKDFPLGSR